MRCRQQQVLGRNVFVLEIAGFLESLVQQLIQGIGGRRLSRAARDFGQTVNDAIGIVQNGLRTNPDLLEHRWNDAFLVLDQRGQKMHRHEFGIAVLGCQIVGALHRFLRLDCKFIPSNCHDFFLLSIYLLSP